tara:strand:+ start:259 stop:558 length:300 start_codon:yes stop_codon:yes gene_type:complete
MQEFRFKDVELTFNFRKLPSYDQDYLRSMIYDLLQSKSIKSSGKGFYNYYPYANNFTLFNNESVMINYMSEFMDKYSCIASHLLDGKKYWFAWTHKKRK